MDNITSFTDWSDFKLSSERLIGQILSLVVNDLESIVVSSILRVK